MFRVMKDKNNPYVMVNKGFVNDRNLSFKAKGILLYLLSKPDNWKVYEADIVNYSSEGKASVRSGIKELLDQGYISRCKLRDKGKFQGYEYQVYEEPHHIRFSENGFSDNGESDASNNDLRNNELTKKNIKEYIELPFNAHVFLSNYNYHFFNRFGKNHMRIPADKEQDIFEWIGWLEDADIEDWQFEEQVMEHFATLPKSNNGSILAFMKASFRYFEVDGMHQ